MPDPARFTIYLTAVVDDARGQSAMWDRIDEALDAIPGLFSEGGGSSLMAREDVIDGSPLDKALTTASMAGAR
jgi:hypothetical protein